MEPEQGDPRATTVAYFRRHEDGSSAARVLPRRTTHPCLQLVTMNAATSSTSMRRARLSPCRISMIATARQIQEQTPAIPLDMAFHSSIRDMPSIEVITFPANEYPQPPQRALASTTKETQSPLRIRRGPVVARGSGDQKHRTSLL